MDTKCIQNLENVENYSGKITFQYNKCNNTSIRCEGFREKACKDCPYLEQEELDTIIDKKDLGKILVKSLNDGQVIKKLEIIWQQENKNCGNLEVGFYGD